MIIKNLISLKENNNFKVLVDVESKNIKERKLWFSIPLEYKEYACTEQYDSFLVGLLYAAMMYGEDIYIEGKISSKLLFNINNYVIPLICSFSKKVKKIKIIANERSYKNYNGNKVGTGFSGGVDSFSTIYDHYEKEKDQVYKINSFLFLNVGSHGNGDEKVVYNKFMERYNYLKKFPEEIEVEFIPVDSNLYRFHLWGHLLTSTLTLVAGVLFLQKNYKKYYCASAGYSYEEILKFYKIDLEEDISIFDGELLPLLSNESIEFISDGNQYDRVGKIKNIINYEPVYKYLNVCIGGEDTYKNCSICSKCCMTLMALESLGKLEEFVSIFDIDKYKKEVKLKYESKQIRHRKKDPYAVQNIKLANENDRKLPSIVFSHFIGAYFSVKKFIKRHIKKEL